MCKEGDSVGPRGRTEGGGGDGGGSGHKGARQGED